jgi:acetyl-CoA acetyltransferase
LLITSAERVADSRNGGVLVRAVEARTAKRRGDFMQSEDITDVAGGRVAPNLFATAGCGPQDIEVAAIYDCFTYTVIAQLEAYGFCSRGEAGAFVREGHLKLDGRLPSNTAGGQLSEAYTHGMNNVIELVRQVRRDHEGTDRQAPNTDLGLCAGWVNPGVASAMILEAIR